MDPRHRIVITDDSLDAAEPPAPSAEAVETARPCRRCIAPLGLSVFGLVQHGLQRLTGLGSKNLCHFMDRNAGLEIHPVDL